MLMMWRVRNGLRTSPKDSSCRLGVEGPENLRASRTTTINGYDNANSVGKIPYFARPTMGHEKHWLSVKTRLQDV